ncbi:glycoside hydrolase superfamily [Aspergillus unguis]
MKWATFFAVLLLSFIAAAIPIEADGVAAPEAVIEVTVWVDDKGHTLSVETVRPTATANNEPTALPPILPVPNNNAPHDLEPALAADVNIKANTDSHHHPKPHEHDRDDGRPHKKAQSFGISYSPYNADNTCKDQAQVTTDIDKLSHYSFVRIYGVDCDQTRKVVNAARRHNMRVFAGVYDLQNMHTSLQTIIDSARPDLGVLHTISIGNELVNRNQASPAAVTSAVADARAYLRGLGYTGPVVTTDTFSKVLEHPELCKASDYCAANCHAFFDATQTPENAGNYVRDISRRLSTATGGKHTIITESGWPHAGQNNGKAVPSVENQRRAIESLRRNFKKDHGNLVLFSAYDDEWKADNQWTFGAEKFWGIHGR